MKHNFIQFIKKYPHLRKQVFKAKALLNTVNKLKSGREILYTFSGRSNYWLHMGSQLYALNTAFRESIEDSRKIISELENTDILPNFVKTADDSFWTESNILLTIVAVQVAINDLLYKSNIYPNATVGFSLGEVAAVYAAGGLSKRDVYKIVSSTLLITKKEKKEYCVINIKADSDTTDSIINERPFNLSLVSILPNNHSIFLVHANYFAQVSDFLDERNIEWTSNINKKIWPYHTALLNPLSSDVLESVKDIQPLPLRCDFFSTTFGEKISKGSILENDYWFKFQREPVNIQNILSEINKEPKKYRIIQVGPDSSIKKRLINKCLKSPFYSTLTHNKSEWEFFKKTKNKIAATGRKNFLKNAQRNSLDLFLANYPFTNSQFYLDPVPYYKYLSQHGSVHFIPSLNGYLILKYDDVKFALNHPEIFSNKPYQKFEKLLISADPPAHKKIRGLLQSLFTRKVYKEIVEQTYKESSELINRFPLAQPFNFVNAFSIPLTHKVIAKFLGFEKETEKEINKIMFGYGFHEDKFIEFTYYLSQLLNTSKRHDANGALRLFLDLIEKRHFSNEEAARLLGILWLAGTTTTTSLISFTTYQLLKNKKLADHLKKNSDLLDKFIDECLRLETPLSELKRVTVRDVTLHNKKIPANSLVLLSIRAANRDERYFEKPDQIILNRPTNQHLAFGGGPHICIGMALGRNEVSAAITTVLKILPQLSFAGTNPAVYSKDIEMRSLKKLSVVLEPT